MRDFDADADADADANRIRVANADCIADSDCLTDCYPDSAIDDDDQQRWWWRRRWVLPAVVRHRDADGNRDSHRDSHADRVSHSAPVAGRATDADPRPPHSTPECRRGATGRERRRDGFRSRAVGLRDRGGRPTLQGVGLAFAPRGVSAE